MMGLVGVPVNDLFLLNGPQISKDAAVLDSMGLLEKAGKQVNSHAIPRSSPIVAQRCISRVASELSPWIGDQPILCLSPVPSQPPSCTGCGGKYKSLPYTSRLGRVYAIHTAPPNREKTGAGTLTSNWPLDRSSMYYTYTYLAGRERTSYLHITPASCTWANCSGHRSDTRQRAGPPPWRSAASSLPRPRPTRDPWTTLSAGQYGHSASLEMRCLSRAGSAWENDGMACRANDKVHIRTRSRFWLGIEQRGAHKTPGLDTPG